MNDLACLYFLYIYIYLQAGKQSKIAQFWPVRGHSRISAVFWQMSAANSHRDCNWLNMCHQTADGNLCFCLQITRKKCKVDNNKERLPVYCQINILYCNKVGSPGLAHIIIISQMAYLPYKWNNGYALILSLQSHIHGPYTAYIRYTVRSKGAKWHLLGFFGLSLYWHPQMVLQRTLLEGSFEITLLRTLMWGSLKEP